MTDFNTDEIKTTDIRNIYHMGHHRGRTAAYYTGELVGVGRELFIGACLDVEKDSRRFPPNELWVSALNEREDADEAWEEYERGVYDGIVAFYEAHNI